MSSWVRETTIMSSKKVEEFSPLPKDSFIQKNTIEEVLPFPTQSKFFLPGSGTRMVDESTTTRDNARPAIHKLHKTNNTEVKEFAIPSMIKPRLQKNRIIPKNPEPFIPLTTSTTLERNDNQLVVKTFDTPIIKPSRINPQTRIEPMKYELKNKPETQTKITKTKKQVNQMGISANPQITIVIPLYNGVEYLEEALESVKRQTYNDWIGIIGVNGHGQSGEPVLSKVVDIINNIGLSNRFTVINLPDVRGAANAINHMVGRATTPYIAHLDADDLWLSKKLQYQMSIFEQDQTIGIVGAMCRYFGDSNDFKILPPGMLNIDDFKNFNPLIHSSILIRKEYAIYSDEFVSYDYDCWVRNISNGVNIFNINNVLVLHRIHSKSYYNTSGKQDPEAIKRKYGFI